jgi:C-terminal processing protease CtpA/Prc
LYIDLRSFGPAEFAGPTAEAAMAFLANTDAIIFDLRQNGGGNPSMIQLIMSYLFEGERLHFNSFYDRPSDSMTYWYTLPWVRGKRMPTQEVYVLTSRNTVSAAEEFTYNLKNMERATIVGETTAGAAHPVNQFGFGHAMYARISVGRAINPYTNTNWEGTGIKPHIEVPVSQALNVAHLEALKHLAEKVENPRRKARIEWAMVSLEALNNPMTLQPEKLKQYVGSFGPRKITLENDQLFYQREDRPKMALVPLAEDLFELEDVPYFRLRFDRDPSGSIVAVTGMYDNGHTDGHAKDTAGK